MAPLDPFLPYTARPLTVSGMSITSRLCKAVLEALRMMGVNLLRKREVQVTAKHGMRKIKALANLKGGKSVKVGVLRGTGDHPNAKLGITIALIAWWNEFGTKYIPSRPFLRTTLREHGYYREHLKRAAQAALIKTAKFEGGIEAPLKAVGVLAASDIRKKITSGPWVPNSDFTIMKKSGRAKRGVLDAFLSSRNRASFNVSGTNIKNHPLIDTGIMRQSIQSALSDEHA